MKAAWEAGCEGAWTALRSVDGQRKKGGGGSKHSRHEIKVQLMQNHRNQKFKYAGVMAWHARNIDVALCRRHNDVCTGGSEHRPPVHTLLIHKSEQGLRFNCYDMSPTFLNTKVYLNIIIRKSLYNTFIYFFYSNTIFLVWKNMMQLLLRELHI